jgi:hypothetical protein
MGIRDYAKFNILQAPIVLCKGFTYLSIATVAYISTTGKLVCYSSVQSLHTTGIRAVCMSAVQH